MDKKKILAAVIQEVEAELSALKTATKAAHEAATAEENKPENEFDTRALEAGYLAQAQSNRAQELERALHQLQTIPAQDFPEGAPIRVGALVEVESAGAHHLHLLLPFGGGISVTLDGKKISVVTASSPLGQALAGKQAGDEFSLKKAEHARHIEIIKVC
jgi:transcription elongation GreA/GreB family factor